MDKSRSFRKTFFGRFISFIAGLVFCATIIGIPLGVLAIKSACSSAESDETTFRKKCADTTARVISFFTGIICTATIIGLPIGFLSFHMAFAPSDENGNAVPLNFNGSVFWASWRRFLSFLAGILFCATLIGIPLGKMAFKSAFSHFDENGKDAPVKFKRPKTNDLFRNSLQLFWVVLTNSYIEGFTGGKYGKTFMYLGNIKKFCNPGLHCYSCPGTYFACPIGAFQAVANQYMSFPVGRISLYVCGAIAIYGSLCGRLVCGFLCPFGLIQDLLNKIPFVFKIKKGFRGDRFLRVLKYAIFAVFIIILNLLFVNLEGSSIYDISVSNPAFCRYICPSGIIVAAFPQIALDDSLARSPGALGEMFILKLLIAVTVIVLSIIMFRPFCKYICPLGAVYAFFNKFSLYRMRVDRDKCNNCGLCTRTCRMQARVPLVPNDAECIRCGDCKTVCPREAISFGFGGLNRRVDKRVSAVDTNGVKYMTVVDDRKVPLVGLYVKDKDDPNAPDVRSFSVYVEKRQKHLVPIEDEKTDK